MIDASDLGPTDGLVYHYTSAPTALEHILHDMTIRLGPLSETNDPWDARRASNGSVPESGDCNLKVFEAVDRALSRARVGCFCRDEKSDEAPPRTTDVARSHWGFARDRMWAQYADGHRGMCLFFDREKLVAACTAAASREGAECLERDVAYSDDPPSDRENVDLGIPPADVQKYALEYRKKHAPALFFTKRVDWQGEREFRIVVLGGREGENYLRVPVRGALVALAVGHRFPDAYRPCVEATCDREDVPAFRFLYGWGAHLVPLRLT